MSETSNAGREAREQAKAYNSVFAPRKLQLDDGTIIEVPPHPNLRMIDDDRLAAYETLLFETETYDRAPSEGDAQGPLLIPYRKNKELVTPPHTVRIVQAVIGDEDYAKLRAGKVDGRRGSAADVWRVWNEQGIELTERADVDPKSDGSSDGVADLATPDS